MKENKTTLLEKLRKRISEVQERIALEKGRIRDLVSKGRAEIDRMEKEEKYAYLNLKAHSDERLAELDVIRESPFFARCDLDYGAKGRKRLYFGKHQLTEENIYSWVSPVAAVRFESPGPVSYSLPSGGIEKAELEAREQYMISGGKVMFYATESKNAPRELVYQEHFSQKTGFMLPEIVSRMEKAQDAVIRAHHKGPFAISGPAGSGKTTLALHRVAFLVQSPESAHLYPENSVIVFVQDNGTKDYFSHLLPELGINHVKITTFFEWAGEFLDLSGIELRQRLDIADPALGFYEYEKIRAARSGVRRAYGKNPFAFLEGAYAGLSKEVKGLWAAQKRGSILDRIDVAFLARAFLETEGKIHVVREYQSYKNGSYRARKRKTPLEYSLMIVDEFQNYMPEQLSVLKACISPETQSAVFVGDMAQRVYQGTIRSWEEIGETIHPERNVRLEKVYRNTREILEYIRAKGYAVEIPPGIKSGPPVVEKSGLSQTEAVQYMESLGKKREGTLGIICGEAETAKELKEKFKGRPNVRVSTMLECQGVEFDTVCLVLPGEREEIPSFMPADFLEEREKIDRDLLYVALTRAMTEMHVLK